MIFVLMALVIAFILAISVSEIRSKLARKDDPDEADRTKADRGRGGPGE
jgi:hypothetical protein